MSRPLRALTLAVLAPLAVVATPVPAAAASVPTPASTPGDPRPAELPDTPAGEQLGWVLEHGPAAAIEEWEDRLSPEALNVITPAQVRDIVAAVMTLGGPDGFTVTDVVERSEFALTAILAATDESTIAVDIVVLEEPPHLIDLLRIVPRDTDLPDAPVGAAEIEQRLAAVAPDTALLVSPVDGDPLLAVNAEAPGPIGSTFKLYVLGAVIDAIAAGDVSWDDELAITDEMRSLPSGELQYRPDGSTTTVEEAAGLMISISDNTATDLLIDLVGVDAVEEQMAVMGAGEDSIDRTVPFLTTRQLFILKWTQDAETQLRYVAADADGRREILSTLPAELPGIVDIDPDVPVFVQTIEWFASPEELAEALRWLDARISDAGMEPLAAVLGSNPGVDLDQEVWASFAYKGGSEPGAISLSWLLTRDDGSQFAVSIRASDPDAAVDQSEVMAIAIGAIDLAAQAD